MLLLLKKIGWDIFSRGDDPWEGPYVGPSTAASGGRVYCLHFGVSYWSHAYLWWLLINIESQGIFSKIRGQSEILQQLWRQLCSWVSDRTVSWVYSWPLDPLLGPWTIQLFHSHAPSTLLLYNWVPILYWIERLGQGGLDIWQLVKAKGSKSGKTGGVGQGLDKSAQEMTALPTGIYVKVIPLEKYGLRGNGNSLLLHRQHLLKLSHQSPHNYNLECGSTWTCVCMCVHTCDAYVHTQRVLIIKSFSHPE